MARERLTARRLVRRLRDVLSPRPRRDPSRPNGPRELVIIASGRSGTSYVCGTLGNLQRSVALYELFSPKAAFGFHARDYLLPRFSELAGQTFTAEKDLALADFVRADPPRTIEVLARLCEEHTEALLSYKIFPDHLPHEVLVGMLATRRPAIIFLVRRRLATYASVLKAGLTRQWSNADSTNTRVEASLDHFMEWSTHRDRWYATMRASVDAIGLPRLTLGYERHVDVPSADLTRTLLAALATFGIEVHPWPHRAIRSTNRKQDLTEGLFERFANGAAFERELRRAGQLDYALQSPLAEDIWAGP